MAKMSLFAGLAKRDQMIRIEHDCAARRGGYWVKKEFIYPPIPENKQNENHLNDTLSKAINYVNSKSEPASGWDETDRIGVCVD